MGDLKCWYRNLCEKHYPKRHSEDCTYQDSFECPIAEKINSLWEAMNAQHDDEEDVIEDA